MLRTFWNAQSKIVQAWECAAVKRLKPSSLHHTMTMMTVEFGQPPTITTLDLPRAGFIGAKGWVLDPNGLPIWGRIDEKDRSEEEAIRLELILWPLHGIAVRLKNDSSIFSSYVLNSF